MKQRITLDQFNELSEQGKENLNKWVFRNVTKDANNVSFRYRGVTTPNYQMVTTQDEYLLTIGQMIEFLMSHTNGTSKMLDDEFLASGIYASRFVFGTPKNGIFIAYNSPEICDSLWSACVEILNTKD